MTTASAPWARTPNSRNSCTSRKARSSGALKTKATFDVVQNGSGTLRVLGLADYVRAKLDDGDNVPRISPYHVGVGLNWDGAALGGGFLLKYSGRQDDVGFAETDTAGFVSLDADASWRPFGNAANVEFALIGRNLTDTPNAMPWRSTRTT